MSSPAITIISLPQKFEDILVKNENALSLVRQVIKPYSVILKSNRMEFFPEYTDHSINHVEEVLKTAEMLIPDDIFEKLTSEDIAIMVISTVLHDIGMQTNADMFKNLIDGEYDDVRIKEFDKYTWAQLWDEYKKDCLYWDSEKKENVFGNKDYVITVPDLKDLQELNVYQKKFIGEFIRIYHCRLAHEVAIKGYIGENNIKEECDQDSRDLLDIAGLIARSHGINIRNTFDYLQSNLGDTWAFPLKVHVVYLMALLRIADYLQMDKNRTNKTDLKARKIYSPFSKLEHETHLAIKNLNFNNTKETIIVEAKPENARVHVKVEKTVNDIQWELDQSWVTIGEAYGKDFTLNYRRIKPNFLYPGKRKYVPQQFSYRFNDSLAKKLIGPLYGDDPSFGVRELVQNAVDACRECKDKDEKDPPHVVVKLDTKEKLFTITDTGKGMTLEEIQKYFLTIGSSFNDNIDWKKWRDDNNVYRSGMFGIGVLAAFLLGDKIRVETRSKDAKTGYSFEAELGDKFIEIKTIDKPECGTKITIKCDSKSLTDLIKQATHNKHIYTKWFNWYIDIEPAVSYFLDDKQLTPEFNIEGFKKLNHSSKLFGDVFWKNKFLVDKLKSCLYCNGFVITLYTDKFTFSLKNTVSYYPWKLPDLIIVDKYNKLPINLKRTNINQYYTYAFEEELAKEMCKSLILSLMVNDFTKTKVEATRLFCFNINNFTFLNKYTREIIQGSKLIHICMSLGTTMNLTEFKSLLKKYPQFYFHFPLNISIAQKYFYYLKSLQNCYNIAYFNDEPGSIFDDFHFGEIFEDEVIEDYKKTSIISKNPNYKPILHDIIDFITENEYEVDYIVIEDVTKDTSNPDPELEEIFQRYLGDDPLIPYDLEERKKKYPLIFQDFPEEIEYYRKIYQEKVYEDEDG